MKHYIGSGFLAFILVFSGTQLFASGVGWLGDAPIRYFSEKDTDLMSAAIQGALSGSDDGVKLEWENAETGSKGSVTPENKKIIDGLDCRDATIFNSAGGREASSVLTFCLQADGSWKLANK